MLTSIILEAFHSMSAQTFARNICRAAISASEILR